MSTARSDVGRVLELINGYQQTSVLVAALQLGVLERLAKGSAPTDVLAQDLGCHAPSLGRLLRALESLRLVERQGEATALTSTGKLLLSKGLGSTMHAWARLVGDEYLPAWAQLQHSVKTGGTAFEHVFDMTVWDHRKQHPQLNDYFNQVTSNAQLRAIAAVLATHDFSTARHVVDVGGGQGNLVAGIVKKHLQATGTVFDQPHVVASATEAFAAAGVGDRCTAVGGSFLESVPSGGDLYVMKHVLHNWDDAHCATILANCRAAMQPATTLLILENVIPEQDLAAAGAIVMLDIHMLAVLGGQERTQREYAALLEKAGFDLVRCVAMREGAPDLIEARAR